MKGWFVSTLMAVMVLAPAAADAADSTSRSLPLPRFVSLKSDKVNVRNGPTKDHDVTWMYTRAGLPVEIVAEFENWRRIRDWEGSEGWVYHSLLSGRRTATVTARSKQTTEVLPVFDKPEGSLTAKLQPGVLGSVRRCNGHWCRLAGDGFDGWVAQERLWGVYPDERIE